MGIFPEMLVCGDITVTTLCTKAYQSSPCCRCDRYIVAPFYMASYYTVVASVLVPSSGSC